MITDLSFSVQKWMFSRKLKEMIFSAPLWVLGEPCFHRHSCWKLASISGRQLVREAWALPAGAKKLKLKFGGGTLRHRHITIKPSWFLKLSFIFQPFCSLTLRQLLLLHPAIWECSSLVLISILELFCLHSPMI